MKIEETEIFGWKHAFHGLRNPMNSWDKSDSNFDGVHLGIFTIGPNDNALAKKLIRAGSDERKFLRFIHVQCFITLPRYIWQELDTYKVATTRLSCSTMHKLGYTDITQNDFQDFFVLANTLEEINSLGQIYRKTKEIDLLRKMKQMLPEGFLQGAEYDMNYENCMCMYYKRKHHRMREWSGKDSQEDSICKWIESLPMMNEWLNLYV